MRGQSVSDASLARAWQAAIAACSVYGPRSGPQLFGAIEGRQAALDQQPVPPPAILIEQQHRLAVRADARRRPRGLDLHQRDQAVHLGFHRRQPRQHPPQPLRIVAERRPHPVVAGGRRVAFVEDQVDHLEHRGEPHGQLRPARHFVRHLLVGERALGADDALLDGGGRQECPGDLVGGEAGEQLQRERHARLGRQHRVARGEDQAQQVVADIVIQGFVEIGLDLLGRPRSRSARACDRRASCAGSDRWRAAWRWPSATRRGCAACPLPATVRAPRRGRPGPDLRRGRRHASCAPATR